jgi:hypothetical protein
MRTTTRTIRAALAAAAAGIVMLVAAGGASAESWETPKFEGKTVNEGRAALSNDGGKRTLTWSDDFKVPGSPDPHWQVVDSKGNAYLLQRVAIKDNRLNRTITIPSYVPDIARVQIWCAWAEVVLGEAAFSQPVLASR